MNVKVIKTRGQYVEALEWLDGLMDAAEGTHEAEELELLAVLIENYESELYPSALPDPIDAIRFRMDQRSLKQKDLVHIFGTAGRTSEVMNRKRPLSLNMMRALHSELGIPAEVFLQDPGKSLPDDATDLEWARFPVWELAKRGWLPPIPSAAKAKELAEDFMRPFLEPLFKHGLADLRCRIGEANLDRSSASYSLLAWIARVVALGAANTRTKFVPGSIDAAFMSHLVQLSQYDDGPLLAQNFLGQHGIQFVVERHLPRTHLDGAVLLLSSGNPIIALTIRHDRLDHFWFTLFHELGHIALHLGETNRIVDEEIDVSEVNLDTIEGQANRFAQDSIIPPEQWIASGLSINPRRGEVASLAKRLFIHPALVAGRVRKETGNYRIFDDLLGRGLLRDMFHCG